MYKVIYNEMVDARVAVTLQNSIFTDINGKPKDDKTKRFGLKQNIKITKPEWILFANESGFNTSQKEDGHVGGQKIVVERGTRLGIPIFGSDFWDPHCKRNSDSVFDSKDSGRFFFKIPMSGE
jgi:hypothetical protein